MSDDVDERATCGVCRGAGGECCDWSGVDAVGHPVASRTGIASWVRRALGDLIVATKVDLVTVSDVIRWPASQPGDAPTLRLVLTRDGWVANAFHECRSEPPAHLVNILGRARVADVRCIQAQGHAGECRGRDRDGQTWVWQGSQRWKA